MSSVGIARSTQGSCAEGSTDGDRVMAPSGASCPLLENFALWDTSPKGLWPPRHHQAACAPEEPPNHGRHCHPFSRSPGRAVWSSSGLRFKKVLKPSIRSPRRPAAKCDGSVTILKRSMNIACGSTYWSLRCMDARVWFKRWLSGNASKGGIAQDKPFYCQQPRAVVSRRDGEREPGEGGRHNSGFNPQKQSRRI